MVWESILHPAVQCGLQVVGLVVCLCLFLGLKRVAREAGLRASDNRRAADERIDALRGEFEEIRARLRRLQEDTARLVEPTAVASGMNITKRTQALRMGRRGEAPGQIAAALSLPQREVELLLKMEEAAMESLFRSNG